MNTLSDVKYDDSIISYKFTIVPVEQRYISGKLEKRYLLIYSYRKKRSKLWEFLYGHDEYIIDIFNEWLVPSLYVTSKLASVEYADYDEIARIHIEINPRRESRLPRETYKCLRLNDIINYAHKLAGL